MRTLARGIGLGGILAGFLGIWLGPEGWTYWHFWVLGLVAWIASLGRPRAEATDYTGTMLKQAGYADPDDDLPTGVQAPEKRAVHGGVAFLIMLLTIAVILWPARTQIWEEVRAVVTEIEFDS
ncbi:hypothetical protein SAMN06309944_1141 [Micrococcales bacterium KH10]|nr:hypothetical protein SAMN06309944_1141 [Micrococcales bacterium KH10]